MQRSDKDKPTLPKMTFTTNASNNYKKSSLAEVLNLNWNVVSLNETDTQLRQALLCNPDIVDLVNNNNLQILRIFNQDPRLGNIFGLSNEGVIEKARILAKSVFIDLKPQDFFSGTDGEKKIYISPETLDNLKALCDGLLTLPNEKALEKYNRSIVTPQQARERLLAYMLAIRLYAEIKSCKLPIPVETISLEEITMDFNQLSHFTAPFYEEIPFANKLGEKAANYFSYDERIKAQMRSGFSCVASLSEVWYDNPHLLISRIRMLIEGYFKASSGYSCYFKRADVHKGITSKMLYHDIKVGHLVSQFPPTVFFLMIKHLQDSYQFSIPGDSKNPVGRMLDPCGGWVSREVATFAHPLFGHYTVIEPNLKLVEPYKQCHQMLAPHKTLTIISKKVEDVYMMEIAPDESSKYHLIFTSPPYMGLEHYPDSSKDDYNDAEAWDDFKFRLLQKGLALHVGGMMVINIATIKNNANKIIDLPAQMESCIKDNAYSFQLQYVGTFFGKILNRASKKGELTREAFVVARQEAVLPPISSKLNLFASCVADEEKKKLVIKFNFR